ncbi:F-BAR and double SH3 domains protein 1-like [Myripristis murdjan]|uniref:F-BAR and double SH3 domains protein 1-like n=1 Tax=Myripristis murdjan TaxID=586833 RepID=UPI001175FBBA|nr:F-BAR and double SH3 domains protein 1-like [Myripristis murdjan]
MQPPPRKVKESQEVKLEFLEQLGRLQTKHQQDTELLEEIRSFSKQRAAIEKEYGQALQRLAVQYQKKDWQRGKTDAITSGVFGVWRSVVDATALNAAARLAAAEEYRALIGQASRSLRNAKDTKTKRGLEQLQRVQGEVVDALRELHRVKKSYHQVSHIANMAREKATDAQARARRSEHGIFHFRTGLHKMSGKLSARLKECDDHLTEVRNDYLLMLASINAHHHHYYTNDLPHVMEHMDGDVYDQMRDHFTLLCRTEMDVSLAAHKEYSRIWDSASKVTRERNAVQFLQESLPPSKMPRFTFQAAPHDKVCVLQEVGGSEREGCLDKEARKWAAKAAKDYKIISHGERVLQSLECRLKLLSGETGLSVEQRIVEVEESIRKAKVSRAKAQARLALLSECIVGVEQYVHATMSQAEEELERERRLSEQRRSTEDFSEDEFELTDFEDYDDENRDIFTDPIPASGMCVYPVACRVIYSYQASQSDELSVTEGEELQVIEDGDMENWLKVCNSCGQVGYVPERYVQFLCLPAKDTAQLDTSSTGHNRRGQIRGVARALYSYHGQSKEELSFQEGALIHLLRFRQGEVDDGFWEGELDGRTGVFPSLVVELIRDEGEEEEEQDEVETLPTPTPPPFSPPIPIPFATPAPCSSPSPNPSPNQLCSPPSAPLPSCVEDKLQAVPMELQRLADNKIESGGSNQSSPDPSFRRIKPCRAPPPPPTQRLSLQPSDRKGERC